MAVAQENKIVTVGFLKSYNTSLLDLLSRSYYSQSQIDEKLAAFKSDGIKDWKPNTEYKKDIIVIKDSKFFRALEDNNDAEFTESKWETIGGSDMATEETDIDFEDLLK